MFISAAMVPATAELAAAGVDGLPLFQRLYPRAARLQAPLALLGAAGSLAAYAESAGYVDERLPASPWLIGGVLVRQIRGARASPLFICYAPC